MFDEYIMRRFFFTFTTRTKDRRVGKKARTKTIDMGHPPKLCGIMAHFHNNNN